jgi:hypothetical protein
MDSNIISKCSLSNYCSTLISKIENANNKGFVLLKVTNANTGKERLLGVAYKTTVKDPGVMLNFCPFCGEHIDYWFTIPGVTKP